MGVRSAVRAGRARGLLFGGFADLTFSIYVAPLTKRRRSRDARQPAAWTGSLGSKKVREQLKIVRTRPTTTSRDTSRSPSSCPTRRRTSRAQDAQAAPVLPYRLGRSAALRPGNLVQVRGFPLAPSLRSTPARCSIHDSRHRARLEPRRLHDRCAARLRNSGSRCSRSPAAPRAGAGGHLPRRIYRCRR